MQTFRDLRVWQEAHSFVLQVYRVTDSFPTSERYGLTSQLRPSAVSVPANIVEGFKRKGDKEFSRFLTVAQASLEEARYLLFLARDLEYLSANAYKEVDTQADTVGKMLHGLAVKVKPGASRSKP